MNPVVSLVIQVLTLAAFYLIWSKWAAARLEQMSAKFGVERLYHSFIGIVPTLLAIGIMWSVVAFIFKLVLKGIVK